MRSAFSVVMLIFLVFFLNTREEKKNILWRIQGTGGLPSVARVDKTE